MNPQVPLTQRAINSVIGLDTSGHQETLSSLTLTIDDYATAYVVAYPPGGTNGHIIVPKNLSQVGTKVVTITANAKDADGNPLTATFQYDIVGATPPPDATILQFGTATVGSFGGVPADPGSATIVLI